MHTYQITGKEESSEKEEFLAPSMGHLQVCLGGSEKQHKEHYSVENGVKKFGRGGYRIAAAGIAGALLAANTAGAAYACQTAGPADAEMSGLRSSALLRSAQWWGQEEPDEDEDREDKAVNSDRNWDEKEILERWDLDPDDFPSEEEESTPQVPDELLSYFQEAASEAVGWYSGYTPPEADLSSYSDRADAIRRAAAVKARVSAETAGRHLLESLRSLAEAAGNKSGEKLVSALQSDAYSREPGLSSLTFGSSASDRKKVSGISGGESQNNASAQPSSMEWFLGAAFEETVEGAESEAGSAGEAADSNGGSGENQVVTSPESGFVVAAPFMYDTDPAFYDAPGVNALPVPTGVYPHTSPASDSWYAEKSEDEDEKSGTQDSFEGSDSDRNGDSDRDGDSDGADGSGYENREDEDGEGNFGHDYAASRREDGIFIPARYGTDMAAFSSEESSQRRILFIGDSRTVGMKIYCGGEEEEYWSAKNSMGYSWMVSTGVPNVEYLIDSNTDVVILMGVNDLGNLYNYVAYINEKAAEWKELGARTFFVSVTPVDDRRSPNAKNYRIENFNAYAQENLRNVHYIDAYSRIRYSFGSPDGIHFDGDTYREIYDIIKFSLYRGWYEQNGLWFYFDCGKPVTGWHKLDGEWQYMDGYGVRWVKNGRVGDMSYIPLPDFNMTGQEPVGLAF